ncbi:MAG: hypothetical protein ABEJ30_05325 [Halorientalis sp.]
MDERRQVGQRRAPVEVAVAAGVGVVGVRVAGDRVGEFGVWHRCVARDVAAPGGRLAVATPEDVLLADGSGLAETGFGPAVAVGVDGGTLVAAAPDGRLARRDGGSWATAGRVEGSVRALDGPLVATDTGVYGLDGGLAPLGLDDAADVAAAGPYAATSVGLYRRAGGEWVREHDGAVRVVAASADRDRAHAAGEGVLERTDGAWRTRPVPVDDPVVDIDYGPAVYAVTGAGTVLVDDGDGWRTRTLGMPDVRGLVVLGTG